MFQVLEIVLLLIAVAAIIAISLDLLRSPLRRRRERSYLEQLSSEEGEPQPGGPLAHREPESGSLSVASGPGS